MRAPAFVLLIALSLCCSACELQPAGTASVSMLRPQEAAPALRLPAGVKPVAQAIELTIDPREGRYSGKVEIEVELSSDRSWIWLNGRDLMVKRVTITPAGGAPQPASYTQLGASGIAALTVTGRIPSGRARISIAFEAAFRKEEKGLYRFVRRGESYAFTQFEPVAARTAFPCFDEPGFKIPYTLTLLVPKGMRAISNTREASRTVTGDLERVSFTTTERLPSYLLAIAVGNLDVVSAPNIPANEVRKTPLALRGVTAKGRAKEIAHALAQTGEILAKLEAYTGIPYPYDKLDIIAVPGKVGAMENVGAVTFSESLLLFDPKTAAVRQRRSYAQTMAHELAHMWVGNLVTMRWWDDLWLNEAFATWLGDKIADQWDPSVAAEMTSLQLLQNVMDADGLVSARAVRQPVASMNDIDNAFDGITYQKGGAVLAMFERWVGPEVWRAGFASYLQKHRHGNATADDLLGAMDVASGKDVKSAFHTYLDQVGVPFIEVSSSCTSDPAAGPDARQSASIHLKQSRYLPVGSSGDANQTWRVPICVRYGGGDAQGEACTLLTGPDASLTLPAGSGCPQWIFPNASAIGYFRFALAPPDLAALRKNGLKALSVREKVAYANSVRAGYSRGVTPFGEALDALAALASESDHALATEAMGLIAEAHELLHADPLRGKVERYGQELYGPIGKKLGWDSQPGEPEDVTVLRAGVLGFLVYRARDTEMRKQAKLRGLHYLGVGSDSQLHLDGLSPDLAAVALRVVGEEADATTWEHMRTLFVASVDGPIRARLLGALSAARAPELIEKVRALVFDRALADSQVMTLIWGQLLRNEAREATWQWIKENDAAILKRLRKHRGEQFIWMGGAFCDDAHAAEAEAFFTPKLSQIDGGPRVLASTIEGVRLCAAKRKAQEPHVRAYFQRK